MNLRRLQSFASRRLGRLWPFVLRSSADAMLANRAKQADAALKAHDGAHRAAVDGIKRGHAQEIARLGDTHRRELEEATATAKRIVERLSRLDWSREGGEVRLNVAISAAMLMDGRDRGMIAETIGRKVARDIANVQPVDISRAPSRMHMPDWSSRDAGIPIDGRSPYA